MHKNIKVLLDPGETEVSGSPTAEATETQVSVDSQSTTEQQTTAKVVESPKLSEDEVRLKLARDIFQKSEPQSDDVAEAEGSDVLKEDTTDETTDDDSGETADPAAVESNKGPVPYKRFEETVREKQKLEEAQKVVEPLVTAQQQLNEMLSTAGVSLQEFQDFVNVLVLSKTDPQAAAEKLKPIYSELNSFSDDSVPAEVQAKINGLAERVTEGELSQAAADELRDAWLDKVKASKQVQLNEKKKQSTEAQRQKAYVQSFINAADSWSDSKRKGDPDYKPKGKVEDRDGLFELTQAFFTRGMATVTLNTPQDVVKLLESAYTNSKSILTPKKNGATKPQPTSRGATAVSPSKPKTLQEVAQRVASKHGIVYVPGKE